MPYKVYKKGSGYKACKKDGNKCFSKKPLTKEKAEAQQKALYASEVKENLDMSSPEGPDDVEGNVAHFNVGNLVIKVTVPENEGEDVTFCVEFQDPGAIESLKQLSMDDLVGMGDLAIEAVRGDSPFGESLQFESLFNKIVE
jgi:hypothetical protein